MLRKNSHFIKRKQNEHMRNIYSEAERRQGSYEFFRNNPEKPLPFYIYFAAVNTAADIGRQAIDV